MIEEIQKGVLDRLRGYTDLTDLLADHVVEAGVKGVYDYVPQVSDAGDDAAFPFVAVGDDILDDYATNTSLGYDAELRIHAWSRGPAGRLTVKQIQSQTRAALELFDLPIGGAGRRTIYLIHERSRSFVEEDGITHHGVQQFRHLSEGL